MSLFRTGLLVLFAGHFLPTNVLADRVATDNLKLAKAFIQYQEEERLQDRGGSGTPEN